LLISDELLILDAICSQKRWGRKKVAYIGQVAYIGRCLYLEDFYCI
jgi:hypothetical protein